MYKVITFIIFFCVWLAFCFIGDLIWQDSFNVWQMFYGLVLGQLLLVIGTVMESKHE